MAAAGNDKGVGAGVEAGEFIDAFGEGGIKFMADAEVQGEARGDFPIVLELRTGGDEDGVVEWFAEGAAGLEGQTDEAVGDRVAVVAAIEAEVTASDR